MNQLQNNTPGPNEEYRCKHCKQGAVEFDMHNISRVDNHGNQLNQRWKREVRCGTCGDRVSIVKLNPAQVIRDEMHKQQFPDSPHHPDIINDVFVQEEETGRPQPKTLQDTFGRGNTRSAVPLNERGGLTPIDDFKKNFSGF